MSNGSRSPSPYFHHASAFGIAGKIDRPTQQTITPQAAISLAPSGGHGTNRVDNFSVPGVLSFKAAYVEVGGSLDTANKSTQTTYALSVIEDLNICNVVTADRVVSRLTVYFPEPASASTESSSAQKGDTPPDEPSFSIVGSHFDNLKIAGQMIDVQLDHETFHDSTYSGFFAGLQGSVPPKRHVLMASNIDLHNLREDDHNYGIVGGAAQRYQQWHPGNQPLMDGQHFWCSAANRSGWAQPLQTDPPRPAGTPATVQPRPDPKPGDLANFGGVICVPRFGVVYLAEVLVYRNHRHLTMIRVRMCSPGSGNVDGPGGGTGGDGMPPRP
ncbi:MAG TPA: hypothetical protein VI685_00400 [Candidatus Angelobacter sp.]